MNSFDGNEKPRSAMERFKDTLYWKTKRSNTHSERSFEYEDAHNVPSDWTYTTNKSIDGAMPKRKKSLLNKGIYIGVVFVLVALLYALLSLGIGGGTISSKNIDISISGPISISAGEALSLEITVENDNDVDLELADLLIEYPVGAREVDNISKALQRERVSLGTIRAGKSAETLIESILFGEEGEKKTIMLGVEYRVTGSNAIFYTEREYEVEIVSSPISMNIKSPNSLSSGQEIEFVIEVRANATDTVKDVLLFAEYPFGFEFANNSTKPSFDDNIWELGDLAVGSVKTIRVRGILVGQDEEERTFRFIAGIPDEFDEKVIGTPFLTHSRTVSIQRPFIGFDIALNGSTKDQVVARVGAPIRGDISWQNNLRSQVSNLEIKLSLNGEIIDRGSISAPNGFYRSGDNTIVWGSQNNPDLAVLNSGSSGRASFSLRSINTTNLIGNNVRPQADIVARITGTVQEDGSSQEIETIVRRSIIFESIADVRARVTHFSGPFVNNGPMPPRADTETTYTITLSASNVLNDVVGARVEAVLPSYVRFMNVINPANETITYNPVGGKVTWSIGDLRSGVGYTGPSQEVSFQVALMPSLSQVGLNPELLTNIVLRGQDSVSDTSLEYVFGSVDTIFSEDSQYIDSYGRVVGN